MTRSCIKLGAKWTAPLRPMSAVHAFVAPARKQTLLTKQLLGRSCAATGSRSTTQERGSALSQKTDAYDISLGSRQLRLRREGKNVAVHRRSVGAEQFSSRKR